jgi:hypothetical protein
LAIVGSNVASEVSTNVHHAQSAIFHEEVMIFTIGIWNTHNVAISCLPASKNCMILELLTKKVVDVLWLTSNLNENGSVVFLKSFFPSVVL